MAHKRSFKKPKNVAIFWRSLNISEILILSVRTISSVSFVISGVNIGLLSKLFGLLDNIFDLFCSQDSVFFNTWSTLARIAILLVKMTWPTLTFL